MRSVADDGLKMEIGIGNNDHRTLSTNLLRIISELGGSKFNKGMYYIFLSGDIVSLIHRSYAERLGRGAAWTGNTKTEYNAILISTSIN